MTKVEQTVSSEKKIGPREVLITYLDGQTEVVESFRLHHPGTGVNLTREIIADILNPEYPNRKHLEVREGTDPLNPEKVRVLNLGQIRSITFPVEIRRR